MKKRKSIIIIVILLAFLVSISGCNDSPQTLSTEKVTAIVEQEVKGTENLKILQIEQFRKSHLVLYHYDLGDGHYIACRFIDDNYRLSGGSGPIRVDERQPLTIISFGGSPEDYLIAYGEIHNKDITSIEIIYGDGDAKVVKPQNNSFMVTANKSPNELLTIKAYDSKGKVLYQLPENKTNGIRNSEMQSANLPYSIRENISLVIRSDNIKEIYGEPDIIRELPGKSYEIRKMADESLLFVFYDKETNSVYDIWRLKNLLSHQTFAEIHTGQATSEDILKIDPYTKVFELSKETGLSEHRLKENEIIIINYKKSKGDWVVEDVNYIKPDPSGFTTTINADDLKLIS